jgi:hypothetical protein
MMLGPSIRLQRGLLLAKKAQALEKPGRGMSGSGDKPFKAVPTTELL